MSTGPEGSQAPRHGRVPERQAPSVLDPSPNAGYTGYPSSASGGVDRMAVTVWRLTRRPEQPASLERPVRGRAAPGRRLLLVIALCIRL